MAPRNEHHTARILVEKGLVAGGEGWRDRLSLNLGQWVEVVTNEQSHHVFHVRKGWRTVCLSVSNLASRL